MKIGSTIIVVGKFALKTFLLLTPISFILSQEIDFSYQQKIQEYQKILLHSKSNSNHLYEALNNLLMFGVSSYELKEAVKKILKHTEYPRNLKIKALEIVHAFYKSEFIQEIENVYLTSSDTYIQSLAYWYLINNNYEPELKSPEFKEILEYSLKSKTSPDPPLKDLLQWKISKNWIFYSIHPRNREHAGILIIKTPEGKFLRNTSGNIFHIPQFARAITNLPYFFINGNTPAGIYRLGKKTIAKNPSIGKTPILPIYLPLEISKKDFLNKAGEWNKGDIKNLFPKLWWEHAEIYESFHAGKLGRSQIAIHGSRVEPHTFKEFEFFPFQPALGCITTFEIWTEENTLKHSYQMELLETLENNKFTDGFVYVVNRNFERRIFLEDILFDILEAEASLP